MRGQRAIFRSGPESLGQSSSLTKSGKGASALGKRINCPLRAVVIVVVMCVDVIDDWRRQEDFTTLL
jgi:hypothetical protein